MEFNRGEIIGRGATATVSIATSASTREVLAVKSADLSLSSFLQREKEILSQLSSPYIVQYKGHQITKENETQFYNLFMEYAPRGTISDLIKKNKGSLDESTIRILSHQILSGLSYLHSNGIVHCDIKGQNVLIGKDGIKIADFGFAKGAATSAFSGTPAYMAPEVARGEEQSFPADIYALGCTVIEMVTGSHPFSNEENPVSVLYKIGFLGDSPEIPMNISVEAKDFLGKCLERDSKERLSAKELLDHPFFDNLKIGSNLFDEFIRVSPTSVLEEGFWDSFEGLESGYNSVHLSDGANSPLERIKGLIELSDSSVPNWDFDEDWISVRINEDEEDTSGVEVESIVVDSYEFGSLSYDSSIDLMSGYSGDVAVFLDSFSVLRDTAMLCENVLLDTSTISVSFGLERKLMKSSIVVHFKCFKSINTSICLSLLFFITKILCFETLLHAMSLMTYRGDEKAQ